jgi:hypothetical protein
VVSRHNCCIRETENPREIILHVLDSAKINVWCGLFHNKVTGPLFFSLRPLLMLPHTLTFLRTVPSHSWMRMELQFFNITVLLVIMVTSFMTHSTWGFLVVGLYGEVQSLGLQGHLIWLLLIPFFGVMWRV